MAGQRQRWQHEKDSGSAAKVVAVRWRRWQQRGGGGGSGGSVAVAASLAALQQPGGSATSLAVAPRQEVRAAQHWRRWQCVDGGGQYVGSAMEADIAAAVAPTAVLPPVEVAAAARRRRAARRRHRQSEGGGPWWRWQRGGGGSLAALWQPNGSAASLAVAPWQEVQAAQRWRWWQYVDGDGQCVGSAIKADIAAAAAPTAVLPPVEVKFSTLC
jgi:hypothetical protein